MKGKTVVLKFSTRMLLLASILLIAAGLNTQAQENWSGGAHPRSKKPARCKSTSLTPTKCKQAIRAVNVNEAVGSNVVALQVLISESGNVISAHALSGDPASRQEAVEEIKKKQFPAKLIDGKPVKTVATIRYKLSLRITNSEPLFTQEEKFAVIPFNLTGMPVALDAVTIESRVITPRLQYSITNQTGQAISEIHVRVFVFDLTGKLVKVETGARQVAVAAHAKQDEWNYLHNTIDAKSRAIVAVTRIVQPEGVWEIEDSVLEKAVVAWANKQPGVSLNARYRPHTNITEQDKIDIFKLIFQQACENKQIGEVRDGRCNIILLKENIAFNVPSLSNINLSLMTKQEIQKKADAEGRTEYLIFQPLQVTGDNVFASVKRRVTYKTGAFFVPLHQTVYFVCRKQDGQWVIEDVAVY